MIKSNCQGVKDERECEKGSLIMK